MNEPRERPQTAAQAAESEHDSVAAFYEHVHQRGAEDPLSLHTAKVEDAVGHLADHVVPIDHGPPTVAVYKKDMRFYRDVCNQLYLEGYRIVAVEVIGDYLQLEVQQDDTYTNPHNPNTPTGVDKGGDE